MTSKGRISLLVVLGAVVLSALATAGTASAALPEWVGAPAKSKVVLTGSGGKVNISEEGKAKYQCEKTSVTGAIRMPNKTESIVLQIHECTGFCFNTEGGEHSILELPLVHGRLGYLYKAGGEVGVGLLLEHAEQPTECWHWGGVLRRIEGSVIGEITPVNTLTNEFTVQYKGPEEGKQVWQHFEGEEALHNLTTSGTKFAIETTLKLTTAQPMELKA